MRILHLHLSREFAGSETYAASLASLQVATGHEVAILVRQSSHTQHWRQAAEGVAVLVLPWWAVGPVAKWVAHHYAKGFAPDILHSHLGRAHKLGTWLGQWLKRPHVGTMHLRFKPKEHLNCDGLIAIAQWQLAEIPKSYTGQVAVIWNWLQHNTQKPPLPNNASSTFTFGSVGRLHPQKGMTTLVAAFQQAFPNNPNVRLEIVGEGQERVALEALIADDSRITLHGYQTQLQPFYARWQAYVSAAKHEPFGLTILEAMAANLPLVCTRTEGPTEFLATQPTQPFWAEKENVESLSQALQACHAQGPKLVRWDMTPFDPARALAQIENLYQHFINLSKKEPA